MREEGAETRITDMHEPGCEIFPGAREATCPTANHNHAVQSDLSRAVGLSEAIPELSEILQECELMAHALIAHSEVSASIVNRTVENVESIDRWSPLFTPWRS